MVAGDGATASYRPVNSCLLFLPDGGRPGNLHGRSRWPPAASSPRPSRHGRGRRLAMRLLHARLRHEPVRRAVSPRPLHVLATLMPWPAISAAAPATAPSATPPCPSARRPPVSFATACRAPRLAWHPSETEGFSRPASVDECLAILARDPSAKLIAGGTDLAVESNLKFRRWPHLVSVEAIDELRDFPETADAVRIGAALPLTEIGRPGTLRPRPSANGWTCSPRPPSAIAPRSAAIWPPPRPSAMPRRCCSRSMPCSTSRVRRARRIDTAGDLLYRLPANRPRPGELLTVHRDPQTLAATFSASIRSPSAAWTTSAPSPPASRWIGTHPAA